ncbi:MAG: IclR family transcriptional regulator [Microcella pacifica]
MTQKSESTSRWLSAAAAPAVVRATAILEMLADRRGKDATIGQIAAAAKIPRSSAANICAALSQAGMLIETDHGFLLGPRLLEFGQAYLGALDPLRSFTTACQNLPSSLSETIQLATLDGLEVVYLGRHAGNQRIQLASRIGLRLPANCTALGKAMLADLAKEESAARLRAAEPLPALTKFSKTAAADLEKEFEQIRHNRYAVDDQGDDGGNPVRRCGCARHS